MVGALVDVAMLGGDGRQSDPLLDAAHRFLEAGVDGMDERLAIAGAAGLGEPGGGREQGGGGRGTLEDGTAVRLDHHRKSPLLTAELNRPRRWLSSLNPLRRNRPRRARVLPPKQRQSGARPWRIRRSNAKPWWSTAAAGAAGGAILAILVVLVLGILAFLFFGGYFDGRANKGDVNVNLNLPQVNLPPVHIDNPAPAQPQQSQPPATNQSGK